MWVLILDGREVTPYKMHLNEKSNLASWRKITVR